jgi:hypothetical protein
MNNKFAQGLLGVTLIASVLTGIFQPAAAMDFDQNSNPTQQYIQDQVDRQKNYIPENDPRNYAPLLTTLFNGGKSIFRPDVDLHNIDDVWHGFYQMKDKSIIEVPLSLQSEGSGWRLKALIPDNKGNVKLKYIDPVYFLEPIHTQHKPQKPSVQQPQQPRAEFPRAHW